MLSFITSTLLPVLILLFFGWFFFRLRCHRGLTRLIHWQLCRRRQLSLDELGTQPRREPCGLVSRHLDGEARGRRRADLHNAAIVELAHDPVHSLRTEQRHGSTPPARPGTGEATRRREKGKRQGVQFFCGWYRAPGGPRSKVPS